MDDIKRRQHLVYHLELEAGANLGCFTNPLSGYQGETFDFPSRSASEGLFCSVAVVKGAILRVNRCEICYEPRRFTLTETYGGPTRKSSLKSTGDPQLLYSTGVVAPCFRFYATVENADVPKQLVSLGMEQFRQRAWSRGKLFNSAHAYQEMFNRRIAKGQCYRTPYFGRREFELNYLGPFRPDTVVNRAINYTLPTMPDRVWATPFSPLSPTFKPNFKVLEGVVNYDQ